MSDTSKPTREPRPHFKYGGEHPQTCKCKACRVWRKRHWAARILERLGQL